MRRRRDWGIPQALAIFWEYNRFLLQTSLLASSRSVYRAAAGPAYCEICCWVRPRKSRVVWIHASGEKNKIPCAEKESAWCLVGPVQSHVGRSRRTHTPLHGQVRKSFVGISLRKTSRDWPHPELGQGGSSGY